MLKEACSAYDFSLGKNDFYRLEKALAYALASGGKHFSRQRTEATQPLSAEFVRADDQDARCFFLTGDKKLLAERIRHRCLQMIEKGIFEEYIAFRDSLGPAADLADGRLLLPIGYRQIHDFLRELGSQLQAHQVTAYSQKGGSLGLSQARFSPKSSAASSSTSRAPRGATRATRRPTARSTCESSTSSTRIVSRPRSSPRASAPWCSVRAKSTKPL